MAKLGNQAYRIVGDRLRIPIKPGQYFYVPLHRRVEANPMSLREEVSPKELPEPLENNLITMFPFLPT